jgi:hypothetical protein
MGHSYAPPWLPVLEQDAFRRRAANLVFRCDVLYAKEAEKESLAEMNSSTPAFEIPPSDPMAMHTQITGLGSDDPPSATIAARLAAAASSTATDQVPGVNASELSV